MPAEVYEVVALAARFWFLLLIGLVVWYSYRWYARERRARRRFLKELPDAGFVGEFVVMRSVGGLEEGQTIRVPFEGTLGTLLNNDIILDAPGVAPRHIDFRYHRERGLKMLPIKGNVFAADHVFSADHPRGLYVVHGTRLYVGECELRLRMFEGYEVKRATPPPEQPNERWNQPGVGFPQGVYARQQPVYAQPFAAQAEDLGAYAPPGAAMQPDLSAPVQDGPGAMPSSPYGQRVRSRFSADGQMHRDNPYRSRRSVPGLRRTNTCHEVYEPADPVPETIAASRVRQEEAPIQETAPVVQATAEAAAPDFSAMSEYARMMTEALEKQDDTAPAAPEAAPAAQSCPAAPEAAPAVQPQPRPARTGQTGFAPAAGAIPRNNARAETIHRVAVQTFSPAEEKLPDMVFEEAAPDISAAEEELFHPLMDEDDWDAWEETPPAPGSVRSAAHRSTVSNAASSPEEDWPYLSRNEQWRTEGLFADLLDDDGTDATALPGGAYGGRDLGSTTRRMLSRYFKGGGR